MIATLVRSIFEQPDRDSTWSQLGDVVPLTESASAISPLLLDAADDILAFTRSPSSTGPRSAPKPPGTPEQGDPPAHRRRRHLPQPGRRDPSRRALLAEQTDEWAVARRYMRQASPNPHQTPRAPNPPSSRYRYPQRPLPPPPPPPVHLKRAPPPHNSLKSYNHPHPSIHTTTHTPSHSRYNTSHHPHTTTPRGTSEWVAVLTDGRLFESLAGVARLNGVSESMASA